MTKVQKTKMNLFSRQYHLSGDGFIVEEMVQLQVARDFTLSITGMRIDSHDGNVKQLATLHVVP